MKLAKRLGAFVVAVFVTTLLGTVLQTQFNLAALATLGMPVPPGTRLDVMLRDLVGFGPTFAIVTTCGFFVAFPVTGLLRRWIASRPAALYALAGAAAILAALLAMEQALGLVAIAAARSTSGFMLLVACGAVGGAVFAALGTAKAR